jgi:exonuclease SbcC
MIPIRLTLRNFLSYGENSEPLDFTGLRVACLSGCNGGGKSALLDGITWALWGQARTSTADDLVRLGQTSMQVEFDFGFDGAEYRVIRKRTRGRSGQSDLQFQVKSPEGLYRAITEQGVRATQDRIIQTLRMDYETFINSAFLLQGRADEFARKGAFERKRILAEILNLRVYDELVEAARLKSREAEAAREARQGEIARAEAELAREPEYQAKIETCLAELESVREKLDAAQEEHRQLLARKADLEAKQQRYEDLRRRLQLNEHETGLLRNQLAQVDQKVAAARSLVSRAEEIRTSFERLLFARKRMGELNAATLSLRRLEGEQTRANQELLQARNELVTRLQLLREEQDRLLAKEKHLPDIQAQIADLLDQERGLEEIAERQRRTQEEVQEAIRRQAAAAGDRARLKQTLDEAQERFVLLKGATARCPVCGDELTTEKRNELGWQLREEMKDLETRMQDATAAEQEAERCLVHLRRQIDEDNRKLKTGRHMTDRLAQARQTEHQIAEALLELPHCEEQIQLLEARLAAEEYGSPVRERLEAVAREIASLGYDEEEHRAVQEEVSHLAASERDQLNLEAAGASLEADEAQAAALREMVAQREQSRGEDMAACVLLEGELKDREPLAAQHRDVERRLEGSRADQNRVTQDLGAYRGKLERCRQLRDEHQQHRTVRDQAVKDRTAYEELARIFGRNGIQALIIENAIPEIEQEANQILARMSDNGMRVAFRTQRDTKTAGVAETLEIDISDQWGTRKYEMFSGGEAFRANFAIRIGLSKLLARRSGARLQTLVIDEGFGSQDTEGRDRLVEAIDSIRDDFEKILVVTHLDELKEFFPNRIEVTKGEDGSQVVVLA